MAVDWSDTIVIAELADEPALSDELNAMCRRLAEAPGDSTPDLVLNMAEVTYLNSSNIAQMLTLRKTLNERQRQMRVCCVRDPVWSVMLVTGLDKVFVFAPDVASGIASLQLSREDDAAHDLD